MPSVKWLVRTVIVMMRRGLFCSGCTSSFHRAEEYILGPSQCGAAVSLLVAVSDDDDM